MSRAVASVITTALVLGCQKDEQTKKVAEPQPTDTSAAVATAPVLNAEIAQAVVRATEQGVTAPSAASKDAPPPNGILEPERANQIAPPGSVGKIAVASEGSAPRFQLGGPQISELPEGVMTVSTVVGPRSQLPTIEFKLSATGTSSNDGISTVQFRVNECALAEGQPGRLPRGLKEAVSSLAGSSFEHSSTQGLPLQAPKPTLGEKADPKLDLALQAAADALTSLLVTYPRQPIGLGGIWMVTSREELSLGEVISYHLYKVEEISSERAVLSVKTQRYLTRPEIAEAQALQFAGTGSGDLVIKPGTRIPLEGRMELSQQAIVASEEGQPTPVQRDIRALYAFPPAINEQAQLEAELAGTTAGATGLPATSAPAATASLPVPTAPAYGTTTIPLPKAAALRAVPKKHPTAKPAKPAVAPPKAATSPAAATPNPAATSSH